jgi:2-(1,2-epoxy-1,2-dihydrophenyl)acetyl-CoA isomerase
MAEVEVAHDGAVQTITLNRPDKLNAFTREVHEGLQAALVEARDSAVRAVVITGAGRGFSAGQDLTAFGEGGDVASMLRATYHVNILAIRALEKPVIAAVNGVCAGAGLSLACACDIRLASDAAFFVPGFVGIGLIPDSGGSYFIQRLLGTPRAYEWMTSNRRLTAAEAHGWGLVSEVVEADAFPAHVTEFAAAQAAAPTRSLALTKQLFDEAETSTLEEQLEREAEAQSEAAQTHDFREGVAAFGEKRAPEFRGR